MNMVIKFLVRAGIVRLCYSPNADAQRVLANLLHYPDRWQFGPHTAAYSRYDYDLWVVDELIWVANRPYADLKFYKSAESVSDKPRIGSWLDRCKIRIMMDIVKQNNKTRIRTGDRK